MVSVESRGTLRRHRQYGIQLANPEVVAIFDTISFKSSNWSRWGSRFRTGTESVVTETKQDITASEPLPRGSRVKLDVKGGLLLSLRYSGNIVGGTRIINDVRLTDLDGVGDDLLSPRATANLVEKLCSKAIQHASWFRFENAMARRNARGFSRNVLRRETRNMRALARIHIKRLRKNVAFADELLGGLPDMSRFAAAAKQSDTVLSHIEQWLKLIEKPASGEDDVGDGDGETARLPEGTKLETVQEVRRSLSAATDVAADPLAPSPPLIPVDRYLELDEDWAPSSSSVQATGNGTQ